MNLKRQVKWLLASAVLFTTGCCMDDVSCCGSNTYVPVNSCYYCNNTCSTNCRTRGSCCSNPCTVCGYDGSYAYTSWY